MVTRRQVIQAGTVGGAALLVPAAFIARQQAFADPVPGGTLTTWSSWLLPEAGFTRLLTSLRERRELSLFPEMVRSLWETMKTGGFSPIL